jgi:hypothetical protein
MAGPQDSPSFAGRLTDLDVEEAALSPHPAEARERDSMALPPTQRYPAARPSPRRPSDPERWVSRPADTKQTRRSLRERLWWILPFGCSLLAGLAFVGACALRQQSGHPDFLGTACAIATIAAVVLTVLLVSDTQFALSTHPVLAICVALFGVPPAVTWVMLAL